MENNLKKMLLAGMLKEIQELSEKDKVLYIEELKKIFHHCRELINQLETDFESTNTPEQICAIFAAITFRKYYNNFLECINNIEKLQ